MNIFMLGEAFRQAPEAAFANAIGREWWIGTGLGGWASGTSSGANMRKYHALFAAPNPSAEQVSILLGKFEETVVLSHSRHELSCNFYPNAVHPKGWQLIGRFSFDGAVARWTYLVEGRRICKEIWCMPGQARTYARYTLLEGDPIGLEVLPLVSGRPAHSIGLPQQMRDASSFIADERGVKFNYPCSWSIRADSGQFRPRHNIYFNLQYPLERERGEAFSEELATPGFFEFFLREGQHATILAETYMPSLAPVHEPEVASKRLELFVAEFRAYNHFGQNPSLEGLVRASDLFIIRDGSKHNIVAGYPYFGRWSRDAMISLPGICIYTGRHALAREIIEAWLGHLRNGLLPNRFGENNTPLYESSDGVLWMFWAISELEREGGLSDNILRRWWPYLRSSLRAWISGNGRVELDGDGLVKLVFERDTWMDVQIDGKPLTPRAGKRVDINALWIHALSCASRWAARLDDSASAGLFDETASAARHSFSKFFNPYSHCLDDGIEPTDGTMRPNALWALALPNIGLSQIQQAESLAAIRQQLFIEGVGMRTLSAHDKNFHQHFEGNQRMRDEAYHQGAAWPWLLGAYAESSLHIYPQKGDELLRAIEPLCSQLKPGALFSIPEVFDPTMHTPGGCPAQAWSVGEVLRSLVMLYRVTSLPVRPADSEYNEISRSTLWKRKSEPEAKML